MQASGWLQQLHQIITRLVRPSRLFAYEGAYFLSPEPPYISQFVGIYPASITPDTLLTNSGYIKAFGARDAEEFTFWAWRDCGIACVQMILQNHRKAMGKTMMDLTREGIKLGGYIIHENGVFVDKGWFHHSLALLLHKHGMPAKTRRWQTIESVARDVLAGKHVMLSVSVPGRRSIKEDGSFGLKPSGSSGGHLLLAIGVKIHNQSIEGIYAHDPRGLPHYQAHLYIPTETFNRIFSSRTIVAD